MSKTNHLITFVIGFLVLWAAMPKLLIYSIMAAAYVTDFTLWLGVDKNGWLYDSLPLILSLLFFNVMLFQGAFTLRRGIIWMRWKLRLGVR